MSYSTIVPFPLSSLLPRPTSSTTTGGKSNAGGPFPQTLERRACLIPFFLDSRLRVLLLSIARSPRLGGSSLRPHARQHEPAPQQRLWGQFPVTPAAARISKLLKLREH